MAHGDSFSFIVDYGIGIAGRLFTKRPDFLLPNPTKSRNREIECHDDRIALKLNK